MGWIVSSHKYHLPRKVLRNTEYVRFAPSLLAHACGACFRMVLCENMREAHILAQHHSIPARRSRAAPWCKRAALRVLLWSAREDDRRGSFLHAQSDREVLDLALEIGREGRRDTQVKALLAHLDNVVVQVLEAIHQVIVVAFERLPVMYDVEGAIARMNECATIGMQRMRKGSIRHAFAYLLLERLLHLLF